MKKKRIKRPRKIKFSFYDPFDDKFLGSFQYWWEPQKAANGWYSKLVRVLIKKLPCYVFNIPRDADFTMRIFK